VHQGHVRFSVRSADGIPPVTKAQNSVVSRGIPAPRPSAREDNRAATQEGGAGTQNKVLVIMEYRIFRKQAYSGTGSQRDSSTGVTDSIQEETDFHSVSVIPSLVNGPPTVPQLDYRYVPLESPGMDGVSRLGGRPSFDGLQNLDVTVLQQVSGGVVDLCYGDLKIHLCLDEIELCLGELRLGVENEKNRLRS